MAGEETVHEGNVVTDKNSETQAEKARAKDEASIEPGKAVAREGKRQGQSRGNQHHAGNRANPENEQIQQRPLGLANRA